MAKTVLKEIIITLLLCIAILLVLGIIFYDYNPLNKVVPDKIAYTTPENIKNELQENEVEDFSESSVNIVYSIQGSDLNVYKKSNSYVSGKKNPFAALADEVEETTNGQTENKTTTTTQTPENVTSNTSTNNKNPDSTGTFLNNTGKK